MPELDQTENFVRTTVDGTHSESDTTISVDDAGELPDPEEGEYNVVWWNATRYQRPDADPNVEIVRVTSKDELEDEITVERGQENTNASDKDREDERYVLHLAVTSKMFEDIETVVEEASDDRLEDITDDLMNRRKAFNTIRNRRDWIEHIFENDETKADELTSSEVLTNYVFEAENDKYDRFIDPNIALGMMAFNQENEPTLTSVYEVALFFAPSTFLEGLMSYEDLADHITDSEVLMDGVMEGDKILENQFGKTANT